MAARVKVFQKQDTEDTKGTGIREFIQKTDTNMDIA
jgi:hypothetical protein